MCIYARTLSLFCAEKKSFFFFLVRHLCPSAVFQKLFFSSFSKWLTGTNVEEGEEEDEDDEEDDDDEDDDDWDDDDEDDDLDDEDDEDHDEY